MPQNSIILCYLSIDRIIPGCKSHPHISVEGHPITKYNRGFRYDLIIVLSNEEMQKVYCYFNNNKVSIK